MLAIVRDAVQVMDHQRETLEHRRRVARRPRRAKQRAKRLRRTAPWANALAMAAFYREAARRTAESGVPHEVDHIVPLVGADVSGLHVENNLRVVPQEINRAKSNRFDLVGGEGFEPPTSSV